MDSKIKDALKIAAAIDEALDGIQIEKIDSCMIPATFFSTAIEHQRSIAVLTDNRLYGSAASLLRSIFESYVKGLWFELCATEADCNRLRRDKFKKTFNDLIVEVEEKEEKGLFKAKEEMWNTLNSLTHSGLSQLSRRISDTKIGSNYDSEFIKDVLRMSSNYGFLSCIRVAKISMDPEALKKVSNISSEFRFPR